jgi:hypothetical protein
MLAGKFNKWSPTAVLLFRFRLRSLFVLVTAVATWLAWQTVTARQQELAVKIVYKYHGSVFYDYIDRNGTARPAPWRTWLGNWIGNDYVFTVVGVGLHGDEIDDVAITEVVGPLVKLRHLQWFGIDNVRVSDVGLAVLGELRQLDRLYIQAQGYRTPRLNITDDGLKFLAHLSSLSHLMINDAPITGRGLEHLANPALLVSMSFDSTDFDDEGLRHISLAHHLKTLRLRQTRVSGIGLANLKQLQELEELDLMDSPVTDTGVASMSNFEKLRLLDLSRSRITDECVKNLSQLKELQVLRLYGTRLSNADILHLTALINLKELRLEGTAVTFDAGIKLGHSLPNCSIQGANESITMPWSVRASAMTQIPTNAQPRRAK